MRRRLGVAVERLPRDSVRHRERLDVVRNSWLGRWLETPSEVEHEARARLAALGAGHADSADWRPGAFERTAMLAVEIHEWDSILRANATKPSDPDPVVWQVDAFVIVRGRLLHLSCEDRSGGTLRRLGELRATASAWIARILEATAPGHGTGGSAAPEAAGRGEPSLVIRHPGKA